MNKETIEEAAKEYAKQYALSTRHISHIGFENGYKLAQERMYSKKEVINILNEYWSVLDLWYNDCILNVPKAAIWFNQYYKK